MIKKNPARNTELKRLWRRNNPERAREINRKYRDANREAENLRTSKWRERNREYNRLLSRAWHHQNRAKNILRMRERYRKNREAILKEKRDLYFSNQSFAEAAKERGRKRYKEKKEVIAAKCKEWWRSNPEKIREITQRRRAKKLGAKICDLTNKQWNDIKLAYEMRCVYCGNILKNLTQDHLVPLSKGGDHTMTNIVPACRPCNSKKRDKKPLPFSIYPLTLDQIQSIIKSVRSAEALLGAK